jgi:hypothetical protein
MIDFPAYCAERLSTHARAWKGTKEDVDHFTLDPNIHDIKSSQDHAALIASIKDILRIFCRQHYLTNKIVSSIQKIG